MTNQTAGLQAFVGQYFIALHPYMYRPGEPARIERIVTTRGRACFHVRYPDGVEDQSPVENEDFSGTGGLGLFYDIVMEADNGR